MNNNFKITLIVLFFLLLIGCSKEKKVMDIYNSKDYSRYKEALLLLESDEELKESPKIDKIYLDLFIKYKEYKKQQILSIYKNTKISYMRHNTLYISDLDGKNKQEVGYFSHGKDFKWSPNGEYLTFNDYFHEEVFILNTKTLDLKQLTDASEKSLTPSWSSDGKKVVYSLSHQLFEIDIETMKKIEIVDLEQHYIYYPHYLTNKELLFVYESKLHLYNKDSKILKNINLNNYTGDDVIINNIGKELLLSTSDNILKVRPGFINLALSSDKSKIQLNYSLIDLNDKTRINNKDIVAYSTSWSPDDKYILYNDEYDNVFIYDVLEENPIEGLDILLMRDAHNVSWSPFF